jgi:hypothetical protein
MPRWNGGVIGAANNPTTSSAKGIWSLSEATKAIRAGLWPPSNAGSDPYFENVTMLLSGDGTNGAQNNTFLDSSTNAFTITRNGNTTQGTFAPFSKPDGRWSNYLNGSSSLSCNVSGISAGTSTFTLELWVYLDTYPASDVAFVDTRSSNGATTTAFQFGVYSTGAIKFYDGTETNLGGLVPRSQWTHIALVRNSSNVVTVYINGIANSTTVSSTRNFSDNYFWIGSVPGPASPYLQGYLSNLRWVVGSAVYTSNFTPSTTPLTAITNTKLLTCQSNRFVDNSTNAYAITLNSAPSIQTFSPFPTTASYDASVNGGSGYFDGTGDFLSVTNNAAFNFGSGAFTIEFWYYPTTLSGTQCLITNYGGSTTGFVIQMGGSTAGSGKIDAGFSGDGADITSTNALRVSSWNHIAISGTPGATGIKLFINGAQEGSTYTGATSLDTSSTLLIGEVASTNRLSGYLCGLRLLKGTAQYTTTFTPPTTPPTAIANTSLLCNFTNGGIIDNTMSNVLETVGNASISTTQSKFGGSSMYFDGNDKCVMPYTQNFNLGTTYTIEAWIYPTTVSGYQRIFDIVNSATSSPAFLDVALNGTALVSELRTANGGGVTTISGGTVSANTWSHVALSVSAGSAKLFLNGTQVGSTTTLSALPDQNFVGIGGIGNSLTIDYLTGYIDDLRVTKGYARYTANFTAPTAPFPLFGD